MTGHWPDLITFYIQCLQIRVYEASFWLYLLEMNRENLLYFAILSYTVNIYDSIRTLWIFDNNSGSYFERLLDFFLLLQNFLEMNLRIVIATTLQFSYNLLNRLFSSFLHNNVPVCTHVLHYFEMLVCRIVALMWGYAICILLIFKHQKFKLVCPYTGSCKMDRVIRRRSYWRVVIKMLERSSQRAGNFFVIDERDVILVGGRGSIAICLWLVVMLFIVNRIVGFIANINVILDLEMLSSSTRWEVVRDKAASFNSEPIVQGFCDSNAHLLNSWWKRLNYVFVQYRLLFRCRVSLLQKLTLQAVLF